MLLEWYVDEGSEGLGVEVFLASIDASAKSRCLALG